MMRSTLGAPLGGTTRGGHQGVDSSAVSLITPPNCGGGGGSCLPSIVVVASGEPKTPAVCGAAPAAAGEVACAWAEADLAPNQAPPKALARAALAVERNNCRRFTLFPSKPRSTIPYLAISALIFWIALAQPTLTSILCSLRQPTIRPPPIGTPGQSLSESPCNTRRDRTLLAKPRPEAKARQPKAVMR